MSAGKNSIRHISGFGDGHVFLEAESRKVGKLSLPDFLLHRIENGRRILVTGSIENRVRRLAAEYAPAANPAMVPDSLAALESLTERLGRATTKHLQEL